MAALVPLVEHSREWQKGSSGTGRIQVDKLFLNGKKLPGMKASVPFVMSIPDKRYIIFSELAGGRFTGIIIAA